MEVALIAARNTGLDIDGSVYVINARTYRPCNRYSWIGRPVRTHEKSICRETKRVTSNRYSWIRRPVRTRKKLRRDQEGYDRFEYIDEKLSTRCIHWWCAKNHIFFYEEIFLKIDEMCFNFFARHSWMRLVKSSNMEVSGVSEVPQSRSKLFF